jgi:hypothetical protein
MKQEKIPQFHELTKQWTKTEVRDLMLYIDEVKRCSRNQCLEDVENMIDSLPRDIPKYDLDTDRKSNVYINILPEHRERFIEIIKTKLKELKQ